MRDAVVGIGVCVFAPACVCLYFSDRMWFMRHTCTGPDSQRTLASRDGDIHTHAHTLSAGFVECVLSRKIRVRTRILDVASLPFLPSPFVHTSNGHFRVYFKFTRSIYVQIQIQIFWANGCERTSVCFGRRCCCCRCLSVGMAYAHE